MIFYYHSAESKKTGLSYSEMIQSSDMSRNKESDYFKFEGPFGV